MKWLKKFLTDMLAGLALVILTVLVVGLIILLTMYLNNFLVDVISNNCYTNMFGEVICKIK